MKGCLNLIGIAMIMAGGFTAVLYIDYSNFSENPLSQLALLIILCVTVVPGASLMFITSRIEHNKVKEKEMRAKQKETEIIERWING